MEQTRNNAFSTAKFVKLLTDKYTGGLANTEFVYKEGLNEDTAIFNDKGWKGGLYFSHVNDVGRWLTKGHTHIARVDIPLDAKTATIHSRLKADKILISHISKLEDVLEYFDICVIYNIMHTAYCSNNMLFDVISNKIRNDMGLDSIDFINLKIFRAAVNEQIQLDKAKFKAVQKTVNEKIYIVMYVFNRILREVLPEQDEKFYDLVAELAFEVSIIPKPTEKQIRKIIFRKGYKIFAADQALILEHMLVEYIDRNPSDFVNVDNPTYKVCLAACTADRKNVQLLAVTCKDNGNISYEEKVSLWTELIEMNPVNIAYIDESLRETDIKVLVRTAVNKYPESISGSGIKLSYYPEDYVKYLEEDKKQTELLKTKLLFSLLDLKEVPLFREFMDLGIVFGSFIRWMMVEIIDNGVAPSKDRVFEFLEKSDIDIKVSSTKALYSVLLKIREAAGYVEFNPISDYVEKKIPTEKTTVPSYGETMLIEQKIKEEHKVMKSTDYKLDEGCVYMVWIPCSRVKSGFVRYDIICEGTPIRNDFTVNASYVKDNHVFGVWFRHLKEKLIIPCEIESNVGMHLKRIYRVRKLQECGFKLDDRYRFCFKDLMAIYEKVDLVMKRMGFIGNKTVRLDKYLSIMSGKILDLEGKEVACEDAECVLALPRIEESSFRRLISDTSKPSMDSLLGPDEICKTKHKYEVFGGKEFLSDDKCIEVVKYIFNL